MLVDSNLCLFREMLPESVYVIFKEAKTWDELMAKKLTSAFDGSIIFGGQRIR